MHRTFSRGLCDSSSGCVLMSATLLPCTGLKASQREWMLSSLLAMCVCAYGLVPVPTMPSYGTLCVPAHTHEQTWPSYICSGENVTWDCAVRCQHIMEFEKNPAGRRHTKTACKRMRAHTRTVARTSAVNAEGKNTTFCLSWKLSLGVTTFRTQQEKVILLFKARPCQQ